MCLRETVNCIEISLAQFYTLNKHGAKVERNYFPLSGTNHMQNWNMDRWSPSLTQSDGFQATPQQLFIEYLAA